MPVKKTLAKTETEARQPEAGRPLDEKEVVRVVKKSCPFCNAKKEPTYTDVAYLRRFMSDRARIVPGTRSNVCSKHQRRVAKEIKYARHLSMLPFVNKV